MGRDLKMDDFSLKNGGNAPGSSVDCRAGSEKAQGLHSHLLEKIT